MPDSQEGYLQLAEQEKQKPDPDTLDNLHLPHEPILRYMSIGKFQSILHSKALFFPTLSKMTDRKEGVLHDSASLARIAAIMKLAGRTPGEIRQEQERRKAEQKLLDKRKAFSFVSSWTRAGNESYALWKIYVPGGEGIAIRTTIGRLCESIGGKLRPYIRQGAVKYAYVGDSAPENVFFRKRQPYHFENEFRLSLDILDVPKRFQEPILDSLVSSDGILVPCDPKFIESVYISPFGGGYLKDVVLAAARDARCRFEVLSSEIQDV